MYKPDLEPVTRIEWPETEDLDYENPIIGIFQSQDSSEFNFMLKDGSFSDLQTTCDLKLAKFEFEEVRFVTTYWKKGKNKEHTLAGIRLRDKNHQNLVKAGASQTPKVH